MFLTIIIFIVILGLLIFVHEAGHFITAKKSGVKVEEFGFGFPPKIFSFKRGETVYSLNWIPLGGFVRIKGEQGEAGADEDSFSYKKIWQRGIILSSGVFMNYLLAVILFSFGFMIGLPQVLGEDLIRAKVEDPKIQIVSVLESSPALEAGIKIGDAILSIEGRGFSSLASLQDYVAKKEGLPTKILLQRGELEKEVTVIPQKLPETARVGMGVGLVEVGIVSYPWYISFIKGFEAVLFLTKEIIIALYELIKNLIISQKVAVDLSGPVGIAVITGKVARLGFIYILQFTALLSLNLAIINFLPFPALDGGRVLFLMIEKIRGRAVSQKIEAVIHNIGFALLMLLIVIVTFRDLIKFEIVEKIRSLF